MSDPKAVYTLEDLRSWPTAVEGLNPPPRLAVIGDPVEHSASPGMHNPALETAGIDASYVRVHLKDEELEEALKLFAENDFLGINVTIPHKVRIAELMNQCDPLAERIGAVNTVLFEDQQLLGFNSDAPGFKKAIREEFFVDLQDMRIAIIGAGGGAGRAVAIQCAEDGCERLLLVNRTLEKAEALVAELTPDFSDDRVSAPGERLRALTPDDPALADELDQIDLIINATNLGMKRADPDPLPLRALQPHHLVFDMVYSPPTTRLMESARNAGARATNGLGMLLWQGAVSFEYWFNREAPISAMREGLKSAVS
ncbi:MAG: shikimate dehydrogenase [Verrucomicrobiales bacterium]|jgi:shikimate dehydrogenase